MRFLLAVALIACFALAACATSDKRSDDSRFGGFYAGTSGGAAP
jgi:hypothetical protein